MYLMSFFPLWSNSAALYLNCAAQINLCSCYILMNWVSSQRPLLETVFQDYTWSHGMFKWDSCGMLLTRRWDIFQQCLWSQNLVNRTWCSSNTWPGVGLTRPEHRLRAVTAWSWRLKLQKHKAASSSEHWLWTRTEATSCLQSSC